MQPTQGASGSQLQYSSSAKEFVTHQLCVADTVRSVT